MGNNKKFAKIILGEQGIKVLQKDIKRVTIHYLNYISHENGEGIEPDVIPHRNITLITMNDGTQYEVLRESVDKDGNFSTESVVFETKEIKVKKGDL